MGQSPCPAFTASGASPSTKAPCLHRNYPASSVPWAYPTSDTARPAPRGVPVQGHTPRPLGDPVLRLVFLGIHAVVFTPADVRTPQRSPVTGLGSGGRAAVPVFTAGWLPRSSFRGLHDVHGYYGLHAWQVPVGLSAPEASVVLLPPLTAPIPSGWNVSACRTGVAPAETQRLFTAHVNLICHGRSGRHGGRGFRDEERRGRRSPRRSGGTERPIAGASRYRFLSL